MKAVCGCAILVMLAIAVLNNGLVHARQPREVAGMLTGALLLLALSASLVPKLSFASRSRKGIGISPTQHSF